jgi:malate dehydrogenase (oxaloacetate-decarboxylating)
MLNSQFRRLGAQRARVHSTGAQRDLEESSRTVRILRVCIQDDSQSLGRVIQCIAGAGAQLGDISKVRAAGTGGVLRDCEVYLDQLAQLDTILRELGQLDGVSVERVCDPVLEVHRGGKIRMVRTVPLERLSDLRTIYTPGVAQVCRAIHADPQLAWEYTALGRTVAIVTNGTAVLGLGNIGVHAGLPVMEGKAVLFDRFAGLSGVPILIPTRDPQTFIDTVIQIAPSFGAIQIEDVAAPECFEIEQRLMEQLPIPVMHDDQHGTAAVVLAALINAAALTGRELESQPVGLVGLGAAGIGIARLLAAYGVKELIGTDLRSHAMERLERLGGRTTTLPGVMSAASVVIATTGAPGLIKPHQVREGQIVFALSNPQPEISPQQALAAGAAFAADGRSVNNALGFPGIFLGALRVRARAINDAMKLAAARAIAASAEPGELIPALLHSDVHQAVATAVAEAARSSGAVAPGSSGALAHSADRTEAT